MFRKFFLIFVLFSSSSLANDNLLTIQQQLERLQREVSDISKSIYSGENINTESNTENNLVANLSSIDLRIYDLEKDVKKINANYEDILFQLDDIFNKLDQFQDSIKNLDQNLSNLKNNSYEIDKSSINKNNSSEKENNTLGTLKITTEESKSDDNEEDMSNDEINNNNSFENQSPEDQFQLAFSNIRNKNYENAKISFRAFIKNNPENQLSGSAHYWLGELYLLEKKYRDAALIFAEGFQKFPESIKAPDMLYKLSQTLIAVNKSTEACNTMNKFIEDYPKHKLANKTKKHISENNCNQIIE